MRPATFLTAAVVGTALIVWAFAIRTMDGMLIFLLGVAILLCTLAIAMMRSVKRHERATSKTNTLAILGSLIGLFVGGYVGASFGLGRVMIAIFNPSLPEQDFGSLFGSIGGGFLGAFILALLGGTVQGFLAKPKEAPPGEDPKQTLPSSLGKLN